MKKFNINRFLGFGLLLLGTIGSILTILGIVPAQAIGSQITIFMLVGITNIFIDIRLTLMEKKMEKFNENKE